ncbi:MAG: hypothetical protein L6427_11300 [Actinomycetia bacterium]|nr:hypothetical protein [Actinomycetes bacterium]
MERADQIEFERERVRWNGLKKCESPHYSHNREVKEQIEAADEMGREVVEEARMALSMFYLLRKLEEDPVANAAQIERLEANIIEKWPQYIRTVDEVSGKMGLGPIEEHIEWIEGLLEETKYK